jgi:D-glycero-D-manno-heptose 1,7-bisphosphate phosphatase
VTIGAGALFLDRDGVINQNVPEYVTNREAFILLPGTLDALKRLAAGRFPIVLVTNQAGVGRGLMTDRDLDEIHAMLLDRVRRAGGQIDAIYACRHTRDAGCACRKPQPGLLRQAAGDLGIALERSIFVGDALTDVRAARSAGCQPLLVMTGRGRDALAELFRQSLPLPWIANSLLDAVDQIRTTLEGDAFAPQIDHALRHRPAVAAGST